MILGILALSYIGVLAVLIVECREKCRPLIPLDLGGTSPPARPHPSRYDGPERIR